MGGYKEKRKKPKKKSIKAPIHSKMDPKRKISRMGKKRQKHKAGLDAVFISRSACLKKLQVTLKDFRRLCILKGIYPRQPHNNKTPHNKKGQVFYHLKDLRALAHEPILEKFRTFKSFMKKVRKNVIHETVEEARKQYEKEVENGYTLHHLVKERYPRFVDALGDLDDALTLTFLYASLPSTGKIKSSITRKAKDIACAWSAYCALTNSITKSFISIKGVYLEAKILSHSIRWIVPHSFTQQLPNDVDYKVMTTFFEFYDCLLHFVLFKLYSDLGVRYPFGSVGDLVSVGGSSSLLSAYLATLQNVFRGEHISNAITAAVQGDLVENTTSATEVLEASKVLPNIHEMDHSDDESITTPLKEALQTLSQQTNRQFDEESLTRKNLFSNLTFFLSREVPRGYLEIIILSYGGKVGWEAEDSPISIKDKSITHHIVDRPITMIPEKYFDSFPKNREFIQPQWVLDSANFMVRLPGEKYGVGVALPPHLSPWEDEEGYRPKYREDIEKLKNGEILEEENNENEESESDEESIQKEEPAKEESESEQDDEQEEDTSIKKSKEEEENKALAKLMMSKKAKRLYGRMQHGIQEKQAKIETLERKRKEVDIGRKDKSSLKQKVERLKDDRKGIEKEYEGKSMKKKKAKK